jgi:cytochrome c peroxidase
MNGARGVPVRWLCAMVGTLASCDMRSPAREGAPARRVDVGASRAARASHVAPSIEISLGARLFQDPRLSRDSTISCATCHVPSYAFAEPRALSHGIGLRARKRNAPSLIDVGVFRTGFDWDGRAAALSDQLRGVFAEDGDMGIDLGTALARIQDDSAYLAHFRRAYSRAPDIDGLLSALVAFQGTLTARGSRFERYYLGGDSAAMTSAEVDGWRIFRTAGCGGCHVPLPDPGGSGVLVFSDDRYHNLGVGYENGRMGDVGRYLVTHQPSDWGAFRTPSLSNVGVTGPYMHDGSLVTLEDVIAFYAKGGTANPNLDPVMAALSFSEVERAHLVAFLRALTVDWVADSASVAVRLLGAPATEARSGVE